MVERTFVVKNEYGIHARPARLIVETASQFQSDVFISKTGEEINAKSIMGILMLEARQGSELVLRVEGEDEEKAIEALEKVFATISSFEEGDKAGNMG